jgi:uncharacterized protein YjgD (DUF1641 family)
MEQSSEFINSQIKFAQSLIRFEKPISELEQLDKIGWGDWDGYLATLTRKDIVTVLQRFIQEEFSAENIKDWAEMLEARGTIQREPGYNILINEVLFTLANEPTWGNPLTSETARRLIIKISNTQKDLSEED